MVLILCFFSIFNNLRDTFNQFSFTSLTDEESNKSSQIESLFIFEKGFTYFLGKIFISILIFYSNYFNYFNLKINPITYELTNDNIIKVINIINTFLDINTKLLAKII